MDQPFVEKNKSLSSASSSSPSSKQFKSHIALDIEAGVEEAEASKCTMEVVWFSQCSFFILGLLIMLIGIGANNSTSEQGSVILDLKRNWELKPIVDILTTTSDWPANYEPLIASSWPGTVEGCDCWNILTSQTVKKELYRGGCSNLEREAGCWTVSSRNSIPLSTYYSSKICAKREGLSYYQIPLPERRSGNNINCPSGYKVCGSGKYDSVSCIQEHSPCPINDIYIGDNSAPPPNGYQNVQLENGISVFFTNNGTNLPLALLKLTEGQLWANPDELDKSEGRNEYILMGKNIDGCQTTIADYLYDPRYTKLSSINEERLFSENGITSVVKELPEYPVEDSKNYDWNLYSTTYVYWNSEWEKHGLTTRATTIDQLINADSFMSHLNTIKILSIVSFVVVVFSIIMWWFLRSKKGKVFRGVEGELKCVKIYYGVFLTLQTLMTFLLIFYLFSARSAINEYAESNMNCSDSYTNIIFKNFKEGVVYSNSYNFYNLIMIFLNAVLIAMVGFMTFL